METNKSITNLKGIGEKKAQKLNNLGIKTIQDLLNHYPSKYEDRTNYTPIQNLENNKKQLTYGQIKEISITPLKKKLYLTNLTITNHKSTCQAKLYSAYKPQTTFLKGQKVALYGNCQNQEGQMQFKSPDIEPYGQKNLTDTIYSTYPLTHGLTNQEIRKQIKQALKETNLDQTEYLPQTILKKYQLMPSKEAIENIHLPQNKQKLQAALYRKIFDELFWIQTNLKELKKINQQNQSIPINQPKTMELTNHLQFELTTAQKKVIQTVLKDMTKTEPMQRIIQGDVGSGKTIIALFAIYSTYLSNHQSALMVPTEILAKQHYKEATKLFGSKMNIKLITGATSPKEKEQIYSQIKTGQCHLVIGTHALIQEKIEFKNLALAITDEQHRFGVKQRKTLYANYKKAPHVLVMTATPIPRTLSLILQGELDISTIDQLPKGRKPIKTIGIDESKKQQAFNLALEQINQGRQTYIVCPLIEENQEMDLQSAQKLHQELSQTTFKNCKLGLLHGKMKPNEKNDIMKAYQENKIQILISTTVIEVGINIPNSTVMIIMDAQRFGLSQLHQLRGRVGRGSDSSYCILIYKGKSKLIKERINVMVNTNDGFIISEKDLELRGAGEIFGMKQHGLPQLKLANLSKHSKILQLSQKIIQEIENDHQTIMQKEEKEQYDQKIKQKFKQDMENIAFN